MNNKSVNVIKTQDKNERIFEGISFILFCVCFCFLFWFLNSNFDRLLNSDDSSELILSRLLADENRLITPNWFYSTELRVFNTQIVYAFFFNFFSDWHKVRIVSCILLTLTMVLSAYLLFRVFKLKKYAWLGIAIMILPTSAHYFDIVLKGAYYYPHIVISILTVAIIETLRNLKEKKIISFILIFALCLLAFLSGLGGPRQLLVIYIPLFVTGVILITIDAYGKIGNGEKSIGKSIKASLSAVSYPFAGTVLAFVSSVAGYVLNMTVLRLHFDFFSYSIKFRSISVNRFRDVIAYYFMNFGYSDGKLFSVNLIHNAVGFVWLGIFIVSLIAGLRRKEKDLYFRFSLLTTVTYLVYVMAFLFTDVEFKDRHSLVLLWMSLPIIFFWFEEISKKAALKYLPVICFTGLLLLTSACQYKTLSSKDDLSELRKIAAILTENGYKDGYATFWNGNVLTELTNGYLDVRVNAVQAETGGNCDKTFEWLQLKSHAYTHPYGKVFCVVAEDEKNSSIFLRNVPRQHLIYETPEDINWDNYDTEKQVKRYAVYGFSSYDEFYSMSGNITIEDNFTIASGIKYQTRNIELYPDEYYAVIRGSGLDNVELGINYRPVVVSNFNKITSNRPGDIAFKVISRSDDYSVLSFKIEEPTATLRISAQNTGEGYSVVETVQIIKKYVYHSDFFSSQYVHGASDDRGTREIYPGGVSFGPEMTLVPGTYVMEVEGSGLNNTGFGVTFKKDGEIISVRGSAVTHTDNSIVYEFTVTETLEECEFRVANNSERSCFLKFIRVRIKE